MLKRGRGAVRGSRSRVTREEEDVEDDIGDEDSESGSGESDQEERASEPDELSGDSEWDSATEEGGRRVAGGV